MTDSDGAQGRDDTAPPTRAVTEVNPPPAHPATELGSPPTHPATELSPPGPTDEVGWDRTATAPGGQRPGDPDPVPGRSGSPAAGSPGVGSPAAGAVGSGGLRRRGPGVPGAAAGQPGPTAEEVWRTGVPPGGPSARGRGRLRRRAGSALTVALLAAVGVVVYLRLHHAPLQVTGVAITAQVKDGCSVDVTGLISTNGGAGTVSYQWALAPPAGAPHPQSQSVTAGQTAIYATAAIQGTGRVSRQVTLQVLGPGQGRATANVIANC